MFKRLKDRSRMTNDRFLEEEFEGVKEDAVSSSEIYEDVL